MNKCLCKNDATYMSIQTVFTVKLLNDDYATTEFGEISCVFTEVCRFIQISSKTKSVEKYKIACIGYNLYFT